MVIVVLAILMTALLAAMRFARLGDSDGDRRDTQARLAKAADALDQFAAAQHRLPCPADPTIDTGVEAITAVGAATCAAAADEGTLPWKTLGLKHDDGYDAWGDKISYRVYTGNKGSLVQPEGVNMMECDTVEPGSGNTTAGAGSAGGLCVSNANPLLRSTSDAKFLQGKELSLSEYGTNRSNVAYILISHGATGYGAYTVSGVRKSYSDVKGDELKNTSANGGFTIKEFSGSDVEANSTQHFDDLLAYRTLPDLVKKIGLQARDWPDDVVGGAVLNAANIAAAMGVGSVSPGSLGTATVNFGSVAATSSTGDLALISDATSGEGLGASGIFGGYLNNLENNSITFQFNYDATKFAVTLGDFGTYSGFAERVQLVFRDAGGAQVASVTKSACNPDGGIASFSLGTSTFRTVEVRPLSAINGSGTQFYSFFFVNEIKACPASASTCTTSLAAAANNCP